MSSSYHAFGLALLLLFSTAGCAGLAPQASSPVDADADADATSATSRFESLASVQSFRALQASIEEMSEVILADAKSEREVSQGMRFLLRTLAMAIDVQGDGNPRAPHFARMDTQVRKVGGDNPDAEYDLVVLDNRRDYVIHGNVGSVRHLSFTVMGGRERGRATTIGYFNERTLDPDEQGRFSLYLTRGDPGNAHHVDTTHGVSSILVRQYIGDRGREELASYEIEVLDPERGAAVPYVTDAEIARAILGTRWAFTSLSTLHRTVMPELLDDPNRFIAANSDDFGADISGSDNLYMLGSYQVDEDEALIIVTDPLEVSYWNLAVESRWHESVDYMSRRTHRTLEDVVVDPDGKLRFVLAHGRTPHPNWLDTGGNREGFLTFRWVGQRDVRATLPVIRRVKRSELESILGATIAESQAR